MGPCESGLVLAVVEAKPARRSLVDELVDDRLLPLSRGVSQARLGIEIADKAFPDRARYGVRAARPEKLAHLVRAGDRRAQPVDLPQQFEHDRIWVLVPNFGEAGGGEWRTVRHASSITV